MTLEQEREFRAVFSQCSQSKLVDHLLGYSQKFDVMDAQLMDFEQKVYALKNHGDPSGRVSHLQLQVAQLREENLRLKSYVRQLEGKNAILTAENDNLKQRDLALPVVCKCGCGELLEQPATGRPKEFVNEAHKKRYYRKRRKHQGKPS